jgi:cytochrome o ubiquinol oxidase operon protein cyoD
MALTEKLAAEEKHTTAHATVGSYTLGFIVSIVLTLTAYAVVVQHTLSRSVAIGCISLLAVLQFLIQMLFFLHLSEEAKPRYRLYMLLFMVLTVGIIVFGSVWIMNNLNYHMTMSPQEVKTYMHANEGL